MRVLLVGNYPPDGQKSMAAFQRMMEERLRKNGHEVGTLRPQAMLLPRKVRATGFWKWVGYIDKFVVFPARLVRASRQFDVTHICDHSNAPYVFWLRHGATVVTCHDVIAIQAGRGMIPGWHVSPTGKLFQTLILRGLRSAQEVVCVSQHTKDQLLGLGWFGGRVSVALNALNARLRTSGRIRKRGSGQQSGICAGPTVLLACRF